MKNKKFLAKKIHSIKREETVEYNNVNTNEQVLRYNEIETNNNRMGKDVKYNEEKLIAKLCKK